VPDALTTKEAAARLGTSKPTVRSLIGAKTLRARKQTRGSRFQWLIDQDSVDAFLASHGRYDEGGRSARSLKSIDERVSALEGEVGRMSSLSLPTTDRADSSTSRQLNDARARIVDLEEALARSRTSAELQREADEARAEVVEHLLAALAAADRADGLRRRGQAELDEAVQGFSLPGHAGDLRDT
jgi:excisionase family DNA binding protein